MERRLPCTALIPGMGTNRSRHFTTSSALRSG